jgi:ABC-2 type transport system permease protein
MMRNPEMLQRLQPERDGDPAAAPQHVRVLIFVIPAITMRMFPEEKTSAPTSCSSSPVRVGEIVLGSPRGLALVTLMVLLSGFFGVLLLAYGNPELPMMLSGYLGLLLMAVSFLAIGTLVSSFTDNVVVAYTGALFALLVLYTIGWLGETVQGPWGALVKYVSITDHFQELLKGLIDTKDLVYFATVLVVSLFLTLRSVESVRWR